jgi:hypothetical protein
MDLGKFAILSLDEAVADAKQTLRIMETSEHDNFMIRLANEAMNHMTANDTYIKKTETVDIIDGRAKLPCGFIRLLGTRFTSGNEPYGYIYVDTAFLTESHASESYVGTYHYSRAFQINNGYIVFNNPQIADTQMRIAFEGRNVDSSGMMVINSRQLRGVNAYICWKFTRSYFELYPSNLSESYHREWINQKRFMTGLTANERFNENKEEIAGIMNAWITNDKNALLRG